MSSSVFNILFVCRHNSIRSQVAELLANQIGHGAVYAQSAGPEPIDVPDFIHEWADNTMHASDAQTLCSKPLSQFEGQHFDMIVTLCDKSHQMLPELSSDKEHIQWDFHHPDDAEALGHLEVELAERLRLVFLAKGLI